MAESTAAPHDDVPPPGRLPWWRTAVTYQVYPRSFADSDGDGVGDLPGVTAHLEHIARLGADAVWLSPFYRSPQADAGYDVSDYTDVDALFGTLADFDALVARAHDLGLRVVVDIVANHSSDEHPLFRAALAAGPGSPERARYLFRDGHGAHGELPPNNWQSVFGGSAWERVVGPDGPEQWYLHLFDPKQPDFDWTDPGVARFFDEVLRFWLDRGIDGFRVDVAHSFVKADGLPDTTAVRDMQGAGGDVGPMWNQDGVHDVWRRWRRIVADRSPEHILVAEAWVAPAERLAEYVRGDEMHHAFNFAFMMAGWDAARLRTAIDSSLAANDAVGATTTWVLSSHDVVRHASRLGLTDPTPWPPGIGPEDEQPDPVRGLRRARALTLLSLALPGAVYVYQGEELGLPDHTTLPDADRQDPAFFRTRGAETGRDGCRVPLPWRADAPGLGFGPSGRTWLPQPDAYRELAVDRQEADPTSTLAFYRSAIALRRERRIAEGRLVWRPSDAGALDLEVGGVRIIVNLGGAPIPVSGSVLLPSEADAVSDGMLAPDAAVWIDASA